MAYLALFAWPVVVIFLFRRLDMQWAAVIAIFGGYLLLPSQNEIFIDLPVLPSFDKRLIPAPVGHYHDRDHDPGTAAVRGP